MNSPMFSSLRFTSQVLSWSLSIYGKRRWCEHGSISNERALGYVFDITGF